MPVQRRSSIVFLFVCLFSALALFPIRELPLLQPTALAVRPPLTVFVSPEERPAGARSTGSCASAAPPPTTARPPRPACPTRPRRSRRPAPAAPPTSSANSLRNSREGKALQMLLRRVCLFFLFVVEILHCLGDFVHVH